LPQLRTRIDAIVPLICRHNQAPDQWHRNCGTMGSRTSSVRDSDKSKKGGVPMAKKICSAVLLVCLLALAGCPEVSQDGGGSSGASSSKDSGGE